jgi:hypothetical protein
MMALHVGNLDALCLAQRLVVQAAGLFTLRALKYSPRNVSSQGETVCLRAALAGTGLDAENGPQFMAGMRLSPKEIPKNCVDKPINLCHGVWSAAEKWAA